jgi:hypothetical protein
MSDKSPSTACQLSSIPAQRLKNCEENGEAESKDRS